MIGTHITPALLALQTNLYPVQQDPSGGYPAPYVVPVPLWQQVQFAISDSMHRVLVQLASFLPGLIALLIALLVMTCIGYVVAYVLGRILTAAKFDDRVQRQSSASLGEWSPRSSPTLIAKRCAFWLCVLVGLAIGISAFNASYPSESGVSMFLLPYLTHSVGAIILLLIGNLIARFLARSVLIGAVNAKLQYARFLSLGVKWLVLVLTAAMVLDHLGIGGSIVDLAFGILFGGIVLTLSLAIGLGSREIVSRSLERNVERGSDGLTPRPPEAAEPSGLRHF